MAEKNQKAPQAEEQDMSELLRVAQGKAAGTAGKRERPLSNHQVSCG